MRLWIGIHLPLLALETFRPRWAEAGRYAVIDNETVLIASEAAMQSGIKIGMRRASASAMVPDLHFLERDLTKEREAFNTIALTLLQYTPEVACAEEDSILLDVTASLNAFGGRLAICRRIRNSIATLGFTCQLSCAPTARGAWLLARSLFRKRRTLKMASMSKRLDALPCTLLLSARPHQEWLHGIGCKKMRELRQLPRAGLQRRTNTKLLLELDRAYGLTTELFEWVKAPEKINTKLELPDRIDHAEALLFSARRLIAQMTGWLVAHQKAVTQVVLWLEHERGRSAIPPTPIEIRLAEPSWQEEHLVRLLKERLGRMKLTASVIAIRLEATHLSPMLPVSDSLFPEPGGTPADFSRLLELLKARLGEEGVLSPTPLDDHRPEIRNRWGAAHMAKITTQEKNWPRPSFLLAKPIALLVRNNQPFYGSPLRLLHGPERIEAGWWDDQLAVRDYFIAQGDEGGCYWIYRERDQEEVRWFLHGLFA